MLIVRSGLPGNPLRRVKLLQTDAAVIASELVMQCRSFYYEPLPLGMCMLIVDPEHAGYIEDRAKELS